MATQAWDRDDREECTIDVGFYSYSEDEKLEVSARDMLESADLPGMYSYWTHYDQIGGHALYYHSVHFSHWLSAVIFDIWLQSVGR